MNMEMAEAKTAKIQAEKKQPEKLSYEKLQEIAGDLQQRLRQAEQRLQQAGQYIGSLQTQNVFSYLENLFKTLEHPEAFSTEFYEACASDVQSIMTGLHSVLTPEGTKETENAADSTQA